MADWAAFAGFAGVVLGLLLLLARASQSVVQGGSTVGADTDAADGSASGAGDSATDTSDSTTCAGDPAVGTGGATTDADPLAREAPTFSTGALLLNVALSQGLFGALLLVGAWYAEIPASALGAGPGDVGANPLGLGVALGVALYALNEVGASAGDRWGLGRSEELRRALAPDTLSGWAVLLFVVLPVIAGFEELLFRGALVGALSVGFDASPWLLAFFSSIAFALGHGAQGPAGVVVTGVLGFALAAAFVVTGSLLVVVVAHYLVNALEFVVHEGLGIEWAS
ncbi:CPBP family intramembrane glutamic endopeptidase [Halegenticoccus tardaugens]|uniref:CPBP family intramembrane glutamic endopeptidase n=1 Tax=Halegenticoccus tardaugens TaxID=2071624 RepID=UPI00100C3328|nr:type II CAAX endopeptidase family protein [Halegenticoccus tardaugens]